MQNKWTKAVVVFRVCVETKQDNENSVTISRAPAEFRIWYLPE